MNENPTWRLDAVSCAGFLWVSVRLGSGFGKPTRNFGRGQAALANPLQALARPQPFPNARPSGAFAWFRYRATAQPWLDAQAALRFIPKPSLSAL